MAREDTTPKIGAGHASAMARQGLKELRGALYPDSNVAQPAEYGIWGTRTPGEVMEERQGDVRDPDEKPSILGERMREAQSRDVSEERAKELERE